MNANQKSDRDAPGCVKSKRGAKRGLLIAVFLIATLCLVLGLFGTVWFFYMTREVDVHDERLIYEPSIVPDEKNGYFILDSVRNEVAGSEMDLEVFNETNCVLSEVALEALISFPKRNPAVLDSFYSVAEYEHCWVPIDPDIPWIEQDSMSISGVIALGQISLCNIKSLVRKKDYHQALDRLHSHLRLGQMINADAHNQITGALGLVLTSMGTSLLTDYLSSGTFSYEYRDEIWSLYILLQDHSAWEHMICAEYSYTKSTLITTIESISSLSEMRRDGV